MNKNQYQTFQWEASHSKGRMMTHHWALENPKAVIALVHGQGEHGGRYHHVANFFQERGYAVLATDLTGHGVSAGPRGHIAKYKYYLKDAERLLLQAGEAYPSTSIYLYGHSMGGNIATNIALRREYASLFQKLIVTSPWYRLAFEPPRSKVLLGRLVRSIYPTFTESSELDTSALSHDATIIERYINDSLVHDKISVAAFFGLMEAGEYALKHALGLNHPMLLMHGTADSITSFEATKEFSDLASQSLMHFKEWDGLYHELHNETNWKEVLTYITDWLEE